MRVLLVLGVIYLSCNAVLAEQIPKQDSEPVNPAPSVSSGEPASSEQPIVPAQLPSPGKPEFPEQLTYLGQPKPLEQPASAEQPALTEQIASSEQPASSEKPASSEQSATSEQSTSPEETATTEQPASPEVSTHRNWAESSEDDKTPGFYEEPQHPIQLNLSIALHLHIIAGPHVPGHQHEQTIHFSLPPIFYNFASSSPGATNSFSQLPDVSSAFSRSRNPFPTFNNGIRQENFDSNSHNGYYNPLPKKLYRTKFGIH